MGYLYVSFTIAVLFFLCKESSKIWKGKMLRNLQFYLKKQQRLNHYQYRRYKGIRKLKTPDCFNVFNFSSSCLFHPFSPFATGYIMAVTFSVLTFFTGDRALTARVHLLRIFQAIMVRQFQHVDILQPQTTKSLQTQNSVRNDKQIVRLHEHKRHLHIQSGVDLIDLQTASKYSEVKLGHNSGLSLNFFFIFKEEEKRS